LLGMDPSSSNISACGSTSSVAVGMGILSKAVGLYRMPL
jgi:hypothetical protein